MVSTDNEFSFLIVSDIHDTIGNVRKLVDWYQKEKPRVVAYKAAIRAV